MVNTQQTKNNLGKVIISNEVIASVAGLAAMECYGLVGMASQKVKDGLVELLRGDSLQKGVAVTNYEDGVDIDLHIVVSYGTKISEVAQNIMDKVHYTVEKNLGIPVKNVNVKVQGVRVKE